MTERICALFKPHTGEREWKAIEYRLLKPCYLCTDDHNRKIKIRKQRTDVRKYSIVNKTIKSSNQLHAGLLASFPYKINTLRKWVENVLTSKGNSDGD